MSPAPRPAVARTPTRLRSAAMLHVCYAMAMLCAHAHIGTTNAGERASNVSSLASGLPLRDHGASRTPAVPVLRLRPTRMHHTRSRVFVLISVIGTRGFGCALGAVIAFGAGRDWRFWSGPGVSPRASPHAARFWRTVLAEAASFVSDFRGPVRGRPRAGASRRMLSFSVWTRTRSKCVDMCRSDPGRENKLLGDGLLASSRQQPDTAHALRLVAVRPQI